MAYPQETIDYAKSLYLELDETGDPAHPWKEMVALVNKKVSDKTGEVSRFSEKVLGQWVNKYGWGDELKALKEAYAKRVIKAREVENKKAEAKAEKDRIDLLNKGASTLEIGRSKNQKAFDALHGIMEAKIYFTGLYHRLKQGEPTEFTQDEIEARMLTPQQETQLYKVLADRAMRYDEIIAEASQSEDHELEVTINVIDKTREVSDGR